MYATLHVNAYGDPDHHVFDTLTEAETYAADALAESGGHVEIYAQLRTMWAEDLRVDQCREFQVRPGLDFPATLNR